MSTTEVKFFLDDPEAKVPSKGTAYAIGYDLTAIKVHSKIGSRTTLYDTGLVIQPPQGYYTEIVPRSSLSKTGYMLSNSVGTIDWDYRGRLLIALTKVDDSLPDLEVPFTRCQLILRKAEYYFPKVVSEKSELSETTRGEGGFGSTDSIRYPDTILADKPKSCTYCNSEVLDTVVEGGQCSKCNRRFVWGSLGKYSDKSLERVRVLLNLMQKFYIDEIKGYFSEDYLVEQLNNIGKEIKDLLPKIKEEIHQNKYSPEELKYIINNFGEL
jgi:deoxyuridine 5'-triphosphate nucleotidohydrolase